MKHILEETSLDRLFYTKCIERLSGQHLNHYASDSEARNVCTKVSASLSDDIDQVCELLNLKKREFCEAAFKEAVLRARYTMEEIDFYENLRDLEEHEAEETYHREQREYKRDLRKTRNF